MAESSTTKSYSSDPTLWLYTSLSSGSSQIVTATSRLETILKANRIPFKALDVATDEKARMLWGRRAGKRKLPGLVKMGMVVGDIDEIEEWNEYGELKEQLGAEVTTAPAPMLSSTSKTPTKAATAASPAPAAPPVPSAESIAAASKSTFETPAAPKPASAISFAPEKSKSEISQAGAGGAQASISLAMRQLGQEAAARAKQNKSDALAARKAQVAAAEKLDNSAPTGMPPPSGTTDATSAAEPETAKAEVESKADTVPTTDVKENVAPLSKDSDTLGGAVDPTAASKDQTSSGATAARPESPLPAVEEKSATTAQVPTLEKSESAISESSLPVSVGSFSGSNIEIAKHRGSSISLASKEEIKEIEEANKIPEEPEEETEDQIQNTSSDKEPHVQFAGEHEGDELDRVKERLSEDPIPSPRKSSLIEEPTKSKDITASSTKDTIPTENVVSDEADIKTQLQPAADPSKASESVQD